MNNNRINVVQNNCQTTSIHANMTFFFMWLIMSGPEKHILYIFQTNPAFFFYFYCFYLLFLLLIANAGQPDTDRR